MIPIKRKRYFVTAGISGLLFAALILLVCRVDVAPIGPEGMPVGLSHLNQHMLNRFGVHMIWYDVTDWLGIAAILTALLFAAAGLAQWVKRKRLMRVDREILALGALYLLLIGLYGLFEIAVVNCRPIIMPRSVHPEASFPSSHTMLVCVVMGSASMLTGRYVHGRLPRRALRVACAIIIGVTIVGRTVSGVHWFTDIVGGILVSAALLSLYRGICTY